jgi:hypothetical protein
MTGPADTSAMSAGPSATLRRAAPEAPPAWAIGRPEAPPTEHTMRRGGFDALPPVAPGLQPPPGQIAGPDAPGAPGAPGGRKRWLAAVIGAVVVLVLAAAGWFALRSAEREPPRAIGGLGSSQDAPDGPQDPIIPGVPQAPADLAGRIEGEVAVFTWTNPAPQEGDTFRWRPITDLGEPAGEMQLVEATEVSLPLAGADELCIEVVTVRADGTGSAGSTKGCAK